MAYISDAGLLACDACRAEWERPTDPQTRVPTALRHFEPDDYEEELAGERRPPNYGWIKWAIGIGVVVFVLLAMSGAFHPACGDSDKGIILGDNPNYVSVWDSTLNRCVTVPAGEGSPVCRGEGGC
jgi:hypothetical protein